MMVVTQCLTQCLTRPQRGLAVVLAAFAALSGCADSGAGRPPAEAFSVQAPEYRIGAGDGLAVFVYQAPDLSAPELMVRPDGRVSLPLVPDIQAAGQTPSQLARAIETSLRRYVVDPNVTVMVRSFVGQPGQQIRVIGEAAQPMTIPYRQGLTVLDVMIEAKGLTRYAAGNRATIVRRAADGAPRETIRVRLADLLRDGDISQDVPMQPGDTLVIPAGWF